MEDNKIKVGSCPKITGNSWLDGVLYGSASGKTEKAFSLFLGTLPASCVETIARSFQAAGFSVHYSSVLDNTSVEDDHVLDIEEGKSSFKTRQIAAHRFVDAGYPDDFLNGYIFSRLFPVFVRTETSKKNDVSSFIQLRLKPEIGNIDALMDILKQRDIIARKIHDGCIEIPRSSFGEDPFDSYFTELKDEIEAHSGKDKATSIKDWQERSYGKIDIALPEGKLLQDVLSPFAISHLSRKAGISSKLSSRERGAIRGISTLLINKRTPTDKQRQYLEGLIKKSIVLGMINDPCDRESCRMCDELKEFAIRFKITEQIKENT